MNISKEFAINAGTPATIGKILVLHSTDNINGTARNNATYEHREWKNIQTFVHFFVDDGDTVYQVGTPGYRAWGAGNVNAYAPIQIELCEFSDRARSLKAYKNLIALVKTLCSQYGIPLTLDDSNRTAGIKSHAWCSQNYGGSDHMDPYPWLNTLGISKSQLLADIKGQAVVSPTPSVSRGGKTIAQVAAEVISGSWGNGATRTAKLIAVGYDPNTVQSEVNRQLGSSGSKPVTSSKTVAQIAQEVIDGKWSNGADRNAKLSAAGYNAAVVQAEVNKILGANSSKPAPSKTVAQVAQEVINGKWGSGATRTSKLTAAGYNATAVQNEVNRILGAGSSKPKPTSPSKSVGQVAKEVINGSWGSGQDRINRLTKAGYNASAVQAEVNKQLGGGGSSTPSKSIAQVAKEVINGDWGNGADRNVRLAKAGYNAAAVQKEVNRQLS